MSRNLLFTESRDDRTDSMYSKRYKMEVTLDADRVDDVQ
jgi:hypothetical protein